MGVYKLTRGCTGEIIKLTLVKVEECKGKEYDLYEICKINKYGKKIPLYCETFTPEQVAAFYKGPKYYITDEDDKKKEDEIDE